MDERIKISQTCPIYRQFYFGSSTTLSWHCIKDA